MEMENGYYMLFSLEAQNMAGYSSEELFSEDEYPAIFHASKLNNIYNFSQLEGW